MKCKQTREAIDTASRHTLYGDSVSSHLSGCPDCRSHADETASLLTLLSAQPRVQAPADFDFRLRARIARAQAEQAAPANTLQETLQKIWTQTFSWGQAATAMAAALVVITASTVYINHRDPSPMTAEKSADQAERTVAKISTAPAVDETRPSVRMGVVTETPKLTPARFTAKPKASSVNYQRAVMEDVVARTSVASNNDSTQIYDVEKRQVVSTPKRDTLLGVENAGLAKPALVAALTF